MKLISLWMEPDLDLDLKGLCHFLNSHCQETKYEYRGVVDIGGACLSNPRTYENFPIRAQAATCASWYSVVFSNKSYDNNYFWDSSGQEIVFSFSDWEFLTALPRLNGALRCLISILAEKIQKSEDHKKNTGCIYDFLWDKSGIDFNMRASTICRDCANAIRSDGACWELKLLEELFSVLDILGSASRRDLDVLTFLKKAGEGKVGHKIVHSALGSSLPSSSFRFEVALSFAGDQKREKMREIALALRAKLGQGRVFFDEWFLAELAGMDAHQTLQNIYRNESRLVVACICERYGDKPWTRWEWRAIQDLEIALAEDERCRFLPMRFDDGPLAGVFTHAIVPDVRGRSGDEVVELILERLNLTH